MRGSGVIYLSAVGGAGWQDEIVATPRITMIVQLDGAWGLDRAFALGYRFTDDGADRWTSRFNAFKAGEARAVRAGIAVMQEALNAALPADGGRVVVFGVPGSAERQLAAGRPVARLAAGLAESRHATLDLGLLVKEPHAPLHTRFTVAGREELLDIANYRTTRVYKDVENYLIVDDLFTRGATIERIMRAIRAGVPNARFSAVALGKTERRQYWLERGTELNNEAANAYEQLWVDNYR